MNVSQFTVSEVKKLSADELVAHGALRLVEGKADEYICPICGNGEGSDGTGIKPNPTATEHTGWKCHKCGEKFDNIRILAEYYGLNAKTDFKEICQRACDEFVISYVEKHSSANAHQNKAPEKISPKILHSEIGVINSQLATGEAELKNFIDKQGGTWRGLPFELLRKKGCRFIKRWIHPKVLAKHPDAQNWAVTSPRMLIPASTNYNAANYLARLTVPIKTFTADEIKRGRLEEKAHAGKKTLFNADLLSNTDLVICVEGYIDAMSLEFAGFNAVALGGADSYQLLVSTVAAMERKPKILILLDSDDAGRKHAPILKKALKKIGCTSATRFLSSDADSKLDANQILVEQGKDALKEIIGNLIEDAQNDFNAFEKKIASVATDGDTEPAPMNDDTEDIIAEIREMCSWKTDRKGNRTSINSTFANIKLIFERDPNLKGLVGFDQFTGENVFLKKAPWHEDDKSGEKWTDADDAQLRLYLRENYAELKEKQLIEDAVIRFSKSYSFNAVKKFYESLPTWDGTKRAETLFVKFLGAEDSEYTREATMKWLTGAVARVYHPGCDFQWALVLQGAQRIGKSKLLKMLGGAEGVNPDGYHWHVALKDSVDDSHAVDALQRGGIMEIEEFSAARKADINALKAFISANEDTRRFSYDKHASTRKRHGVFAVTCNDDQFLRDPTGNARFWIIKCTQEKFKRAPGMTPEYIRQVLAEVYVHYNELFKDGFDEALLKPSEALEFRAEEIAEQYLQDDGMTTEIKAFLDKKLPPKIIWHLLSKEERREFFSDGGKIQIEQADIEARFKNSAGKRAEELQPEFDEACRVKAGFVRQFAGRDGNWQLVFYGAEPREHICAAEIFNEGFGTGDKRKAMYRINEILSNLDGWHLGARLQKADPEYREQRKPYYRDKR